MAVGTADAGGLGVNLPGRTAGVSRLVSEGAIVGYDVHITRAEHWVDSEEHPISLPEWLRYVASDPEMRLDGVSIAHDPKGNPILAIESEGLAVWTAYSKHEPKGNMA
jgi:hypothetical protein